jgi:hypothetical protein
MPPSDQTPITRAIAVEAREVLRKRKQEKDKRDVVRFWYGNRLAAGLRLPEIFKLPQVYRLHPEPDVAAALMVVHRFAPQVSSDLFNYNVWATQPTTALPANSKECPCHTQVLEGTPLQDGHVLSTDPSFLKSPYLRDILAHGKKYRVEQPLPTVLRSCKDGLRPYIDYKMKFNKGDPAFGAALERWSHAVMAVAKTRLQEAAKSSAPTPDGYSGLKEQLKAASSLRRQCKPISGLRKSLAIFQ